jgi:hypothetical protein
MEKLTNQPAGLANRHLLLASLTSLDGAAIPIKSINVIALLAEFSDPRISVLIRGKVLVLLIAIC